MIDSSCICWTAGVWRCDGKSGIWPRRTTEIHSLRTSAATRYRTRSGTDLSLTPILQFNRRKISVDAPASWPKLIPVKQQYKAIILGRTERQFRKALCFSRDVFFKIRYRISELFRPSPWNFATWSVYDWILWCSPKFRGLSPKNLRPKTCRIWGDFTQLPTLIANISGT